MAAAGSVEACTGYQLPAWVVASYHTATQYLLHGQLILLESDVRTPLGHALLHKPPCLAALLPPAPAWHAGSRSTVPCLCTCSWSQPSVVAGTGWPNAHMAVRLLAAEQVHQQLYLISMLLLWMDHHQPQRPEDRPQPGPSSFTHVQPRTVFTERALYWRVRGR